MNAKTIRSGLALLMAVVMLFSLTACGSRGNSQEPDDEQSMNEVQVDNSWVFLNPLEGPSVYSLNRFLEDLTPLVAEKYVINDDVIGWLRVPNTTIDDVVVHYPGDNNRYYLRRGLDRRTLNDGTYFADYRSTFDGGNREGMSRNTTLYGHSFTDSPEGTLFSQLKKYLNADFARENPYIYFSTENENMAWEIFAVFYATVDLPYNIPEQTDEEFLDMIDEVTARSLYLYDYEVTEDDKIITLSTCCYNFTSVYPNDYRYVVMARLVADDEELREEAAFNLNGNVHAP